MRNAIELWRKALLHAELKKLRAVDSLGIIGRDSKLYGIVWLFFFGICCKNRF